MLAGNPTKREQPRKEGDSPITGQAADVMHCVGDGSATGDPKLLLKNTALRRESQTSSEAPLPALGKGNGNQSSLIEGSKGEGAGTWQRCREAGQLGEHMVDQLDKSGQYFGKPACRLWLVRPCCPALYPNDITPAGQALPLTCLLGQCFQGSPDHRIGKHP